jgi:hypothetical protein
MDILESGAISRVRVELKGDVSDNCPVYIIKVYEGRHSDPDCGDRESLRNFGFWLISDADGHPRRYNAYIYE